MGASKGVYLDHDVEETSFIDPSGKPGARTGRQAFACLHRSPARTAIHHRILADFAGNSIKMDDDGRTRTVCMGLFDTLVKNQDE